MLVLNLCYNIVYVGYVIYTIYTEKLINKGYLYDCENNSISQPKGWLW